MEGNPLEFGKKKLLVVKREEELKVELLPPPVITNVQEAVAEPNPYIRMQRIMAEMAKEADALESERLQLERADTRGKITPSKLALLREAILKDIATFSMKLFEFQRTGGIGDNEYVEEFLVYIVERIKGVMASMNMDSETRRTFLLNFQNSTNNWQDELEKRLKSRNKT